MGSSPALVHNSDDGRGGHGRMAPSGDAVRHRHSETGHAVEHGASGSRFGVLGGFVPEHGGNMAVSPNERLP